MYGTDYIRNPQTGHDRRTNALCLLREHEARGELPTSIRFLYYELVQKGLIDKSDKKAADKLAAGIKDLRDVGQVPWEWIVDETRTLHNLTGWESVEAGVLGGLSSVRLDPWSDAAPLVICESRSLAGVLRGLAVEYRVAIASTNGQAGGFLHTDLGPYLEGRGAQVLYLGDYDLVGHHIEANTRGVLDGFGFKSWTRIAITKAQTQRLDPALKRVKEDKRFKGPRRWTEAWETEVLGQTRIVSLVRRALDGRLKRVGWTLAELRAAESEERDAIRQRLKRRRR